MVNWAPEISPASVLQRVIIYVTNQILLGLLDTIDQTIGRFIAKVTDLQSGSQPAVPRRATTGVHCSVSVRLLLLCEIFNIISAAQLRIFNSGREAGIHLIYGTLISIAIISYFP